MKEMSISKRSIYWRPILDGAARERALETVRTIATRLSAKSSELDDPSLTSGCAGLALLYAYCAKAEPDDDDEEIATQFLLRAIALTGEMTLSPSLYHGFTGVAWAVEHLRHPDDEDTNEAVDEALVDYLSQSPWQDDYDLVAGLVGIGVYALERLPRVSARACLERIVDRLDEKAERSHNDVTWLTDPNLLPTHQREKCPNGYYNLGLAHGVPGVIALLGEVCAAGVATERARRLLDGAVAWLLRQRRTPPSRSSFSRWTGPDIEQVECRLAWCYGDAGVAAALLAAARCVNEPEWEREALRIARRATARVPESAGVKDAALCHGAAGLGHIFNRLFQATGESGFHVAGQYWFEQTLAMKRPGRGIAGFSAFTSEEDGEKCWFDDPGILTGAAGIALALLAAVTDIEPVWDRMLLVSIPGGQSKTSP
jgi:class I lanthipeptide synthase